MYLVPGTWYSVADTSDCCCELIARTIDRVESGDQIECLCGLSSAVILFILIAITPHPPPLTEATLADSRGKRRTGGPENKNNRKVKTHKRGGGSETLDPRLQLINQAAAGTDFLPTFFWDVVVKLEHPDIPKVSYE